jgi:hypothetical protein
VHEVTGTANVRAGYCSMQPRFTGVAAKCAYSSNRNEPPGARRRTSKASGCGAAAQGAPSGSAGTTGTAGGRVAGIPRRRQRWWGEARFRATSRTNRAVEEPPRRLPVQRRQRTGGGRAVGLRESRGGAIRASGTNDASRRRTGGDRGSVAPTRPRDPVPLVGSDPRLDPANSQEEERR